MSNEYEKAQQVLSSLKQAEIAGARAALPILNGLVQSAAGSDSIKIDEKRASAFLAICEVGKALHRGHPTGPLWTAAIDATERRMSSAKL